MAKGAPVQDTAPCRRTVVIPPDVVCQCRSMPVIRDLHVLAIGSYPVAGSHHVKRPNGLPEAILIHCVGGRGWCRIGGREWRLSEGMAIVIPPGEAHEYAADPHAPWTINWVHFGGRQAAAYLDALGATVHRPMFYLPGAVVLEQAFEELYSALQLGYTQTCLIALSTQLGRLLGLVKVHQRSLQHKKRQAEERVLQSLAYMRENIAVTLTLADLAGHVHMSVPNYCSVFRRQTKSPPIVFLIRLKMQRACELLTSTDLPVGEIARAVGHDDPFYFSRVFKRVVGLTPTDYRRTMHMDSLTLLGEADGG